MIYFMNASKKFIHSVQFPSYPTSILLTFWTIFENSTACLADNPCRYLVNPSRLLAWPTNRMSPTNWKTNRSNFRHQGLYQISKDTVNIVNWCVCSIIIFWMCQLEQRFWYQNKAHIFFWLPLWNLRSKLFCF